MEGQKTMIAIVLVGGKQSLVSELHPELPTPLFPVAGEHFLYWLTMWLKNQGFTHIVFSAGHYADKVVAWVNHFALLEPSLCLDVVTESRPLGTAGATAVCAKRYPSSFTFVINGDSILLTDLNLAISKLQMNENLDAIILGTRITNAGRFGTLEHDEQHRLISFREKQAGKGLINAGVYLLRNELLADINSGKELSLEYDCFPKWLADDKHIHVMNDNAPFIDIGSPHTLKRAESLITQYHSVITGQKEAMIA